VWVRLSPFTESKTPGNTRHRTALLPVRRPVLATRGVPRGSQRSAALAEGACSLHNAGQPRTFAKAAPSRLRASWRFPARGNLPLGCRVLPVKEIIDFVASRNSLVGAAPDRLSVPTRRGPPASAGLRRVIPAQASHGRPEHVRVSSMGTAAQHCRGEDPGAERPPFWVGIAATP